MNAVDGTSSSLPNRLVVTGTPFTSYGGYTALDDCEGGVSVTQTGILSRGG